MKQYRVLLIAMSGVRIWDPDLRALGLTLPGFVDRGNVIASLPSLSLLTLAGWCPPHWEPVYREIDELTEQDIESICSGSYDLIAISSLTARINDTYVLSSRLRKAGLKVVVGGLHATVLPDEVSKHVDSVVVGQGELVWSQILKDVENGKLQTRYDASGSSQRNAVLDHSRVPRYDLLDIERYNRLTIQTSRGCPHHCYFCAASRLLSQYQFKPVDSIRKELDAIFSVWPRPFIELADDNTFVNRRWSISLLKLFSEYPMKWFTESDISLAEHPETLELLSASGCAQVLVGFESASPEGLTGIDARDWKRRKFDSYADSISRIQSYGVSVNGCFILGLDTDDEHSFELTRNFITQSELTEVQITLLTPFPGTELYDRLLQEGRLFESAFWDRCTLFDLNYKPKLMSSDTLRSGFRQLMTDIYAEEEVSRRRKLFRQCRRQHAVRETDGTASDSDHLQ